MATEYVVLREDVHAGNSPGEQTVTYYVVARHTAASAQAAVRQIADEHVSDGDEVVFQAVPVRSWDAGRHTVTAKTERKVVMR